MSGHTPGPWYSQETDRTLRPVVIHMQSAEDSVEVYGPCRGANANLIAAAPDMLPALEAVLPHLDVFSATPHGSRAALKKVIGAIIAKAKGEA